MLCVCGRQGGRALPPYLMWDPHNLWGFTTVTHQSDQYLDSCFKNCPQLNCFHECNECFDFSMLCYGELGGGEGYIILKLNYSSSYLQETVLPSPLSMVIEMMPHILLITISLQSTVRVVNLLFRNRGGPFFSDLFITRDEADIFGSSSKTSST